MTKQTSDAVRAEFISECEEISQRVSLNFQKLEKKEVSQDSSKIIDELYRDMHTMKGTSQLFGFVTLGRLAHVFEASLDPIRRTGCSINQKMFDTYFKSLDLIDGLIRKIDSDGSDDAQKEEVEHHIPKLIECVTSRFDGDYEVLRDEPYIAEKGSEKFEYLGEESERECGVQPEALETPSDVEVVEKSPKVSDPDENEAIAMKEEESSPRIEKTNVDSTVRVNVALLDRLMNIVGELVLVRNEVLRYSGQVEDLDFLNLSQRLDVVTSDIQGEVMRTRMQPIGNILNKYQRLVRDVSRDLNKQIDITLQGVETELDKSLLEAIKDPLTHLVRNSCDHGIESPKERKNSGKPETGHVLIKAYHEGGQVVVEVSDDGKGLDREVIRKKAVDKGLVSADDSLAMTDRAIFNFVFSPGFSTAAKVSSVSGRGVGMDVVKNNIEKIGGMIDFTSRKGHGTSIQLKIPLTLAIVPAMIVRVGEQDFAIPQVKLVELVRIEQGVEGSSKVEYLQGQPVFRLRGDLLPLVDLKEILKFKQVETRSLDQSLDTINIVVLNAEGHYFGLIVDEILDTADIVVKPLTKFLKLISVFSGSTIMGDGLVSLILDVNGLANHVSISTGNEKLEDSTIGFVDENKKNVNDSDAQEFMLFNVKASGKYAVPLCLVHRLEEFPKSSVEYSGEQRVLLYRDSILPIVSLNRFLGFEGKVDEEKETLSVIVVQKANRLFGIEVDRILEVVTVLNTIDGSLRDRRGILGSVIFDEEVVVVVDVFDILDEEIKKMKHEEKGVSSDGRIENENRINDIKQLDRQMRFGRKKILYAEDVAFFRKQVSSVLVQAGYDVETAVDGAEAFDKLSSKVGYYDLLLTDIEMPNLNGFDLARKIKSTEDFKGLPMVALTTKVRQRDIDEGNEVGFSIYLEKLNPETLLTGVQKLLPKKEKTNEPSLELNSQTEKEETA